VTGNVLVPELDMAAVLVVVTPDDAYPYRNRFKWMVRMGGTLNIFDRFVALPRDEHFSHL